MSLTANRGVRGISNEVSLSLVLCNVVVCLACQCYILSLSVDVVGNNELVWKRDKAPTQNEVDEANELNVF